MNQRFSILLVSISFTVTAFSTFPSSYSQSLGNGRKLSVLHEFQGSNSLAYASSKNFENNPTPSQIWRDVPRQPGSVMTLASPPPQYSGTNNYYYYPSVKSTTTPSPQNNPAEDGHDIKDCEYYHHNNDHEPGEEEAEKEDDSDFFMLPEHEGDIHGKPGGEKSHYSSMPDFGHSPDLSHHVDPFHSHDVEMALNPAWPTAAGIGDPPKGSIDYVLIPMILIGFFLPLWVVVYVILGGIIVKLQPVNLRRSISQTQIWDSILPLVLDALDRSLDNSDEEML